jgi:transposase InsO family protein
MARDGVAVGPEVAALVTRFVSGERFDVTAECARLGCSRSVFYKYVARFRADGVEGLFPRSRRPDSSPARVPPGLEDEIVRVRKSLGDDGWDNGADSIRFALEELVTAGGDRWDPGWVLPSRATINRVLSRRGQLVAVPQRRPRSAIRRFQADHPNTRWQMDGFETTLTDGTVVVVLHLLDDCSRYDLALNAVRSENAVDVWDTFTAAVAEHGLPRVLLTDNGTAFSGRRRGWLSRLEQNLSVLGVKHITSSIGHPQTCGKCERGHKTVLKWLAKRTFDTVEDLNTGLATYRSHNNERRRRVHLDGLTPAQRYRLGPKDGPAGEPVDRVIVNTVQVGANGAITLDGHHFMIGRRHSATPVTYIRRGKMITIFNHHGLITEADLTTRTRPRPPRQSATLSTKS